jgi:hypothetical protein
MNNNYYLLSCGPSEIIGVVKNDQYIKSRIKEAIGEHFDCDPESVLNERKLNEVVSLIDDVEKTKRPAFFTVEFDDFTEGVNINQVWIY